MKKTSKVKTGDPFQSQENHLNHILITENNLDKHSYEKLTQTKDFVETWKLFLRQNQSDETLKAIEEIIRLTAILEWGDGVNIECSRASNAFFIKRKDASRAEL